jgi:hypothetical protein
MIARAPGVPAARVASRAAARGAPLAWAYFSSSTHASRGILLRELAGAHERGDALWISTSAPPGSRRLAPHELYRTMLSHAAIVCPRGNGLDTHRMWETLLLGRIAIVERSSLDPLWDGLPVVVLDSWSELETTAEARVAAAIKTFSNPDTHLSAQKLFLPYWMCLIGRAAGRRAEFCSTEGLLAVLRDEGERLRAGQ